MKELVCEVREKVLVIFGGISFLILGIGLFATIEILADGEVSLAVVEVPMLLLFGGLGIYSILAFFNHRLRIFADGSMIYSSSVGKKVEFRYSDIVKIEQKQINGTLSLSFFDASGKRFGKIESNMKGYEELCHWLKAQKKKAKDAENIGILNNHELEITPVNGNQMSKAGRAYWIIAGLIIFAIGVSAFSLLLEEKDVSTESTEVGWFDSYTANEAKQMVEFDMISYPFANFEVSDSQALYFVFDSDMTVYIVCMDNEHFETEFADIYEYTFSDTAEYAGCARVEGYAEEIDEDLKAIAIEEFNYLWGNEVLTEDNFEEYIGYYYLDTTYQPKPEGESSFSLILGGIFLMGLGIYGVYLGVKPSKKKNENISKEENEIVLPKDTSAEAIGLTHKVEEIGELPIPRSIFISILASIVCATAGGALWVLVHNMGRITWIAGYLAVAGAIFGYCKIGRRELNVPAGIWCIAVGLCSIGFANYLAYAWEIAVAINASNPGRTDFWHVLEDMPWLMKEMGLWKNFFTDLAIGVVFALIAGVSNLFGKKKKG